ncbi:MAG: DUF2799 domain-containing protein [Pseudomonadales bacterium]
MRTNLMLLVTCVLAVAGCSSKPSVSENQCAAGDWQTIGYRDGVNGMRSSQLLAHQDACMEHGITPDRSQYMLGWDEGVREYCEPNNGFDVGERGWGHNNVCPEDMRAAFLAAYQEGRTLYQARADVANLEREIDQKTARLSEVKSQIVTTTAAQIDGSLTPTQRVELATRVQRLYEEKQQLEKELPDLEAELSIRNRELDRLVDNTTSLAPAVGSR